MLGSWKLYCSKWFNELRFIQVAGNNEKVPNWDALISIILRFYKLVKPV